MRRRDLCIFLVSTGLVLVAGLALGPRSCDAGIFAAYLGIGMAAALVTSVAPWLGAAEAVPRARVAWMFLGMVGSSAVWVLGFVLGGFRILCRLF